MKVMSFSVLAASLIGSAVALSGATFAPAATLAPGRAHIGENAVQAVGHNLYNRPGRRHGPPRYHLPKNSPQQRQLERRFHESGPGTGLRLIVPGFGHRYGYSRPYGYGPYSHGYRGHGD